MSLAEYRYILFSRATSPIKASNSCVSVDFPGDQACKGDREFVIPDLGVPNEVINRYVSTHYYVDLELMVGQSLCL